MKKRLLTLPALFLALQIQAQQDSSLTPKPAPAPVKEEGPDWANIRRYKMANEKFGTFRPGVKGVVFIGDSITDGWINSDSSFWSSNPYLDRGIGGQTTTQMLVRFRQDAINLKPQVIVILAGINDIAQNNGPITVEEIFGNIKSMAILAREAGIKVVLCSVLPANRFPWRPQIIPTEKVGQLNALIKGYAQKENIVFVDYYTPMADSEKGLPKNLAEDGIHPTLAGYRIMEPLVQQGIKTALEKH